MRYLTMPPSVLEDEHTVPIVTWFGWLPTRTMPTNWVMEYSLDVFAQHGFYERSDFDSDASVFFLGLEVFLITRSSDDKPA